MLKKKSFLDEVKNFSVGMTIRHCHYEGTFRRLKNLFLLKTQRFLVEAKELLCRNDNTLPVILKELLRLKNLSLSKTQRILVEAKWLLCRNDNEIPRRSKRTSLWE